MRRILSSTFWASLLLFVSVCTGSTQTAPRGLILGPNDGEKRYYPDAKEAIVIKIDPVHGGSQHIVLETFVLGINEYIPVHRHLYIDEILMVQHGTAAIYLAGRRERVSDGATAYFPANTWMGVKNVGTTPLSMVAIFSAPGFEQRQRLVTVTVPGGKLNLTPAERAAINKRYGVEYNEEIPIVKPR